MKPSIKTIVFCLFLLFTFGKAGAQIEFSKVYFKEFESLQATSVVRTFDSAYMIAGIRNSKTLLFKTDVNGEIIWNKSFELFLSNEQVKLTALQDSTFLSIGSFYNSDKGYSELMCIHFTTLGDTLWVRSVDLGSTAYPYSVQQTLDSGFVVAATIFKSGLPPKIAIVKLDQSGGIQWSKSMQGEFDAQYVYSVKQTSDTAYLVTGYAANYSPYAVSSFLMKLTSDGTVSWSSSYQAASLNNCEGREILVLDDGFLVGLLASSRLILMKTDFTGEVLWAKNYNLYAFDFSTISLKITKTDEDGFVVLTSDAITKMDSLGNILWSTGFNMYVADMVVAVDNGFFVLGNGPLMGVKKQITDDPQIGIAKTDSLGQNDSECVFGTNALSEMETIVRDTIAFTSEDIGEGSQISVQISSEPFEVEPGCVAFVGAVDENDFEEVIRLFPNPSSGVFNIQTINREQLKGLRVFNSFGKLVFQIVTINSAEYTIDLRDQPPGVYLLKISIQNKTFSRKIIID